MMYSPFEAFFFSFNTSFYFLNIHAFFSFFFNEAYFFFPLNLFSSFFVFVLLFYFFILFLSLSNKMNYYFFFFFSLVYNYFYDLIEEQTDNCSKYFPFFFFLFIFIAFFNLIGLIPYSFAVTSHLIVTFSVSSFIWFFILYTGLLKYGMYFFFLFVPSGVPSWLVPFIIIIESISFFFRMISLALRLFANIVSGHILLELISLFSFKTLFNSSLFIFIKFLYFLFFLFLFLVLFVFETFISLLQAYIFTLLSLIYISELIGNNAHLHVPFKKRRKK